MPDDYAGLADVSWSGEGVQSTGYLETSRLVLAGFGLGAGVRASAYLDSYP
jgi:hypothetical protein